MKSKLKLISSVLWLLTILSCGSNNTGTSNSTNTTAEENISPTQDSSTASDSNKLLNTQTQAPYNFLDKVTGSYTIISKGPDYVQKKVNIKLSGKKVIVDGQKYQYDISYKNADTLIEFSAVSEESGDFLGGGTILINGSKIQYKMFYGPEASEEYIYEKRVQK